MTYDIRTNRLPVSVKEIVTNDIITVNCPDCLMTDKSIDETTVNLTVGAVGTCDSGCCARFIAAGKCKCNKVVVLFMDSVSEENAQRIKETVIKDTQLRNRHICN